MAAKIKDGLFIGDAETSQSEVFINDNKISNLINLSGREVNNIWAPHGLVYLTYFWEDRPDYKILNTHEDSMLKDIVEFIDVSISHGISVLLFSSHGTGRCAIAACIYLMMKYRWGFEKTYDYVYSKKPDINLNKGFIQQMFALDMKLLSARQKSFALKYPGSSSITDSGFKIEANMTINDISAMLPPNEAKRWNAWEPDYITGGDIKNSNSILLLSSSSKDHYLDERKEYDAKSDYKRLSSSSSSRNKHANVTPGQQSSSAVTAAAVVDVEAAAADELLLVYSFLNSKNTITSLPGPYPDIYDIPKSFKIRFNSICFEEDVNWFPPVVSLPNNSRNSNHHHHMSNNSNSSSSNNKVGLPRSALKGSRNKEKQMMMLSMNSDSSVVPNTAQPKTSSKHNHASFDSGASSKQLSSHGSNNSSNSVDFKSIYPEENIATISMNMNNNQRRERSNSSNNNNNNYNNQQLSSMRSSSQQHQQQQISNDLYEFVGITNTDPARSRANRGSRGSGTRGSRELIAASTDHHLDIDDVDESSLLDIDLPPNNSSNNNNNNSTRNHHTETTAAGSSSSHSNNNKNNSNKFNNSVTAEERLRNLMTDMQRHKPTASSSSSGGDNDVSASGSSNNYHHHHHNSVAGPSLYELATMKLPTSGLQSSKGMMNGAMAMDTRLQMADYGMDELLYAFDQQQQLHNSATAGSNNSNSSSNKANVIRARHDIVTHRSNQNSNNNSNSSNNNNQYHNHSSGSSSNNGTRSNASSPVMTRPSPKSAWGGQGSVGPININPKTALPGSSSRPGSPSPGQTSSQPGGAAYPTPNPTHSSSSSNNNNNHIPSRYSSPSSSSARSNNNMTSGAAAAAANSSNLSINSLNSNASGSNNVVGSGMNSATKVYRHGSPASNIRTAANSSSHTRPSNKTSSQHQHQQQMVDHHKPPPPHSTMVVSDLNSVANSSLSSLGSSSGAAVVPPPLGSSHQLLSSAAAAGGNRYNLDPYLSSSSATNRISSRPASPQQGMSQRRSPYPVPAAITPSSNHHSTADSDNQQQQRRRAVNNSPLRASFTASATNSGGNAPVPAPGVTSRRYPMGAPLATIHHDHDSTNTTGASSAGSNKPRSSTPTKAWKF